MKAVEEAGGRRRVFGMRGEEQTGGGSVELEKAGERCVSVHPLNGVSGVLGKGVCVVEEGARLAGKELRVGKR